VPIGKLTPVPPRPPQVTDAGITPCYISCGFESEPGLPCDDTRLGHLGVTVEPVEVHAANDFERAFSEISKRGLQGVVAMQDGLIYNEQPQMFRLAVQHRLPLIGYTREMAGNGALMTYGPNNAVMFRRAAAFVDKILKGDKKPSDIPVEQPTRFELLINLKTAKAIGLEVPPIMLSRADEVIE
jgi:putative ABC transport system substrate-binding protein